MKTLFPPRILLAASLLAASGHAWPHSASAVLDPAGNNAAATDLAQVICYDDGNGPADRLYIQIQDLSPPAPGLLLSAEIFKDGKMTNTTDTVSADALASNPAVLVAGDGVYYLSVSKTAAGARSFTVTYHCQTANDTHTGTDISVLQGQ